MGLISYQSSPSLEGLYGLALVPGQEIWHKTHIAQYLDHFFFLEQLENTCPEVVEVRRQSTQIDGAWVSLECVQNAWREGGGRIDSHERGCIQTLAVDSVNTWLFKRRTHDLPQCKHLT
jgi:hypothetical protein